MFEFYDRNVERYNRLKDEVAFAITQALDSADIKAHLIEGRVKSLESLREKVERKGYSYPETDVQDIVGARVVVRFLSDLSRVEAEVNRIFDVLSRQDKVEGEATESFGYMSMHYNCKLGAGSAGPRYDAVKDIVFELQVRTMLMDAWANVSHYLAYKGGASIPLELRRDFFALSGLFYVADQHFELFYGKAMESQAAATTELADPSLDRSDLDLNLETAMAFLERFYPDRHHTARESVSEFVQEVTSLGYRTVGSLEAVLEKARRAAEAYELDNPPSGVRRYADVGIARQALAIADPSYALAKYRGDRHDRYRHYMDS